MVPTSPTFGLVNGRPLFLDLRADSYFLLEAPDEDELLAALGANRSTPGAGPVDWPTPSRQLDVRGVASRPNLHDLVAIWRILNMVRRRIRRDPLADIVGELFEPDRSGDDRVEVASLARRFHDARCWLPHQANCLSDSLALLFFFKRHCATADLVFGAKLDPFAAHCWVQSAETLLNDSIDRIESFTPVAVLKV